MKKLYILIAIISLSILVSCSKDDENKEDKKETPVVFGTTKKVENLYAPSGGGGFQPQDQKGKFVKFDFGTGKITESETDWDIAFRYATILVNGGAKAGYDSEPERNGNISVYIAKDSFEELKTVDTNKFKQDSKGNLAISDDVIGQQGIWSYNIEKHILLPIPGRVLVFQTSKGNYVKMEVLSFYKDAPQQPQTADKNYGYYTFKYSIGNEDTLKSHK